MRNFLGVFLLLVSVVSADWAVLHTKAGQRELMAKPSKDAKVVTTVLDTDILSYYDLDPEDDWFDVSILRKGKRLSGYLQSSSMKVLEKLPEYRVRDLTFKYLKQPFKKEGKKLEWTKDGYLLKIDGHNVSGADGGIPKVEVKGVEITLKGKKLNVAEKLWKGMYEPNDAVDIYEHKGSLLIHSINSDGGGAYDMI